jgi:hypothetical protein
MFVIGEKNRIVKTCFNVFADTRIGFLAILLLLLGER